MSTPRSGQFDYEDSPERPIHQPDSPVEPYGNPPAPAAEPGWYAYPSQPARPGDGPPGGYPGHVPPSHATQPLALPAEYGWNAAPPHRPYGTPQPPPGYGDPGYRGPGYGPEGYSPAGPGLPPTMRTPSGPGRMRVVLAVVTVLALAAIGGVTYLVLGHSSGRSSAQGGHSPAASQASHSAAPVTHHGDLRRYLIAAPSTSHAWPKPLGTDRKLSLRQAAHLNTNAKAGRTKLVADHFIHGAVRCWITKGGTWVDVRLYQFASAAEAQSYSSSDIKASSRTTPAADRWGVSKVPGARVFADPKPDSEGYIGVIAIGVKGDVVIIVDIAEHSDTAQLGTPDRLTQKQYSKL